MKCSLPISVIVKIRALAITVFNHIFIFYNNFSIFAALQKLTFCLNFILRNLVQDLVM